MSTTKDFAAALGYTADLTTDAKTGTMTYDAAKAGNSGTDAEVELSVGKVIGEQQIHPFSQALQPLQLMETE